MFYLVLDMRGYSIFQFAYVRYRTYTIKSGIVEYAGVV
jgi:hypothetical protein